MATGTRTTRLRSRQAPGSRRALGSRHLLLIAAALLALTGCAGHEAGPSASRGAPQGASLSDIATKVRFVQQDQCFRQPIQHGTNRCDRYLAQVTNIGSSAAGSGTNPQPVAEAGRELVQRIKDLRGRACLPPQPDAQQDCANHLAGVDQALVDVQHALAAHIPPTQ